MKKSKQVWAPCPLVQRVVTYVGIAAITITALATLIWCTRQQVCSLPPSTPTKGNFVPPSSIAVMTMYVSSDSRHGVFKGDYDRIGEAAVANRKAYAALHGYSVFVDNHMFDFSRALQWSKIQAVKSHLTEEGPEYVLFSDADMLIMNPAVKVEDVLAAGNYADLIISKDSKGINTGIFAIRNCEWSRNLLDRVWEERRWATTANWTEEYFHEQSALQYLLDNDESLKPHVSFLPACSMNGKAHHGWNLWDLYWPGDFILHFAGSSKVADAMEIRGEEVLDYMRRHGMYEEQGGSLRGSTSGSASQAPRPAGLHSVRNRRFARSHPSLITYALFAVLVIEVVLLLIVRSQIVPHRNCSSLRRSDKSPTHSKGRKDVRSTSPERREFHRSWS